MQENKELVAFAERLKKELPKVVNPEGFDLSPWHQSILIKAKINEILGEFLKGGDR